MQIELMSFKQFFFSFLVYFRLKNSLQTLGEIFKTKGDKTIQAAKNYYLYYDFEPGFKNPLLLFVKG